MSPIEVLIFIVCDWIETVSNESNKKLLLWKWLWVFISKGRKKMIRDEVRTTMFLQEEVT